MDIFEQSMTHWSVSGSGATYDRLEYLGDAVFHLVLTEYLYERYDIEQEGFSTRLRIRLERGESMVELSRRMGLDKFVRVLDMHFNDNILEDIFEAFIGALYLSLGIKFIRHFIIKLIEKYKTLPEMIINDNNYKDLLLRYYHQKKWGHPVYNRKKIDYKTYVSKVCDADNIVIGTGESSCKKTADQIASKNALICVGVMIDDEIDQDWIKKIERTDDVKEKEKDTKTSISIYNSENILIRAVDVKDILKTYGVPIPIGSKIDIKLYREAMTHKSYIKRKKQPGDKEKDTVPLQVKSYERIRFIGDSLIHFVVGEYLYHKYPTEDEGFLTKMRCKLENRDSLFYLAKITGIDCYLLISQLIDINDGRNNSNIVSSGLEAFIGALHLNYGLLVARTFVVRLIQKEYDMDEIKQTITNYKEIVLQVFNSQNMGTPTYVLLKESGPDHCKKYTIGLYYIDDNNTKRKQLSIGSASSKKRAEQNAAQVFITNIQNK
jgi:dsRNA-specific ribonuclease